MSFRSNLFHKNRSLNAYNSLFTLKSSKGTVVHLTKVFAKNNNKKKKQLNRGILLTQRKANLKSAITGRHGLQIMNCH